MNLFTEYMITIFTAGICAFICESVCTGFGTSKNLGKTLSTVTSLIMVIIIVFPIGKVIKNKPTFSESNSNEQSVTSQSHDLISLTISQLEAEISEQISMETGIKPQSIIIDFIESDEIQTIEKITVILSQTDIYDRNDVDNIVKKMVGDNIIVEITEIHK